jgi:hypothetical protein
MRQAGSLPTRYKGQIPPRQIDRDYPHQIEIAAPGDGLGPLLNAMHDACRGAEFKTRGIGRKGMETGRDGIRFCFKSPELADAFEALFGGEQMTVRYATVQRLE